MAYDNVQIPDKIGQITICLTIMQFAWTQYPFKGQGGSVRAELACLLFLLTTTVTWLLGDSLHSYNPE